MNCIICQTKLDKGKRKQCWVLNDYYGFSGICCCDCYYKIEHDGFGKPKHPVSHRYWLEKYKAREYQCVLCLGKNVVGYYRDGAWVEKPCPKCQK